MTDGTFHIFTRAGNGTDDIEAVKREMKGRGLDADGAGYAKHLLVTRADQTVVFLTGRDVPFALALRRLSGWREPGDEELP